jgi:hypothetical protein
MQENSSQPSIELIVGMCGVILGLVSLFFAWQANQIARETNSIMSRQITDDVVVLKMDTMGSANTYAPPEFPEYRYGCTVRARIANQGGAATAIVKYAATLFYNGKATKAASADDFSSEHILSAEVPFAGKEIETNINIWLGGQEHELNPDSPMPITIAPFSAIDVETEVILSTKDLKADTYVGSIIGDANVKGQIQDGIASGYSPLEVDITYFTSSGKQVSSPNRAACFLIKPP